MTSTGTQLNYDDIIIRQQKRISELKMELIEYETKLDRICRLASEIYHVAVPAASASGKTSYSNHDVGVHSQQIYSTMFTHPALSLIDDAVDPQPLPLGTPPSVIGSGCAACVARYCHCFMSCADSEGKDGQNGVDVTPGFGPKPTGRIKEDKTAIAPRYWTEEEHNRFLHARALYGPKNYEQISKYVATRNPKQVRTHSQKFNMKLRRDVKKTLGLEAPAAMSAPQKRLAEKLPGLEVDKQVSINSTRGECQLEASSENASSRIIRRQRNEESMKKSSRLRNSIDICDFSTASPVEMPNVEEEPNQTTGDNICMDLDEIDECFGEEPFADLFGLSDE